MALTTCSECGGKVSDKAESCPHCGCLVGIVPAKQPDSPAAPVAQPRPAQHPLPYTPPRTSPTPLPTHAVSAHPPAGTSALRPAVSQAPPSHAQLSPPNPQQARFNWKSLLWIMIGLSILADMGVAMVFDQGAWALSAGLIAAVAYGAARKHVWNKHRRNTVFEEQPEPKTKPEQRAQGVSWGTLILILVGTALWHAYETWSHDENQKRDQERARVEAAKLQREFEQAHGMTGK